MHESLIKYRRDHHLLKQDYLPYQKRVLGGYSPRELSVFLYHDFNNLLTATLGEIGFLSNKEPRLHKDKEIISGLTGLILKKSNHYELTDFEEYLNAIGNLRYIFQKHGINEVFGKPFDIKSFQELVSCYLKIFRFIQIPDKKNWDLIFKQKVDLEYIYKKHFPDHTIGNESVNGVDAVIFYNMASKFVGDFDKPNVTHKNDGEITFSGKLKNDKKIPERFKRYVEPFDDRKVPSKADLTFSDNNVFSPGLFLAELLAYGSNREIIFKCDGDDVVFTLKKL